MKLLAFALFLFASIAASGQATQNALQDQIFFARDKVLPALVHIEPIIKIYHRGEKQHALVTGSGVIFSQDGYVLTNHHVAANAEKVWVTISNKERITARVIGSDQSTDIAVLKLNIDELTDPEEISFAGLGNSDSLQVGQIVLALGSPLGLSRSVSMGVISSIDRYFPDRGSMVSPYNLWIQTDAAINPGNSGGPLINLAGEVIGINARAVFLAENLGFAIPINLVQEVSEEIIEGSEVRRSWIGMEFQSIKDLREYLEKPELNGVLVAHVEDNSPAKKAGLRPGDVIQKIDGQDVNVVYQENLPTVRKIIANLPIDQKVQIEVLRKNKTKKFSVKTVEEPLVEESEIEVEQWGMVVKGLSWHMYRIQNMTDFNGVYVTSVKPGSPSEYSKIRGGDVIRSINGEAVINSEDFQEKFNRLADASGEPVYLELIRNRHPYFTIIKQSPAP